MIRNIGRALKSLNTDEEWDADVVLVSILCSMVLVLGLQVYSVVSLKQQFDPSAFGTGISFILGVGGFGYAAKRVSEKGWFRYGSDFDSGISEATLGSHLFDRGFTSPADSLRNSSYRTRSLSEIDRGSERADF